MRLTVEPTPDEEAQLSCVANSDSDLSGIFWSGRFEQSYIPAILNEIYIDGLYAPFLAGRSDLTIVDAGANVGLTAMYFSQFARRVIAVEPDEQHLLAISATLKYNRLTHVHVCSCALADSDSEALFYSFPSNATMGTLRPLANHGWQEERMIRTISLRSLLAEFKVEIVDLFKLDIEGGEAAVVRSNDFAELAPRIAIWIGEWHAWSDIGQMELMQRFSDAGYRFSWLGRGRRVHLRQ